MPRPVPDLLIAFLRRVEGVRREAYPDAVGVWTIGVGHTGPDVRKGLTWTDKEIDTALRGDLARAVDRLASAISAPVLAALTDGQYAALLSFIYNCGSGARWEIWTVLNQRRFADVPGELIKFVNAGGRKLQGLVSRREAEIALWNGTDPLCTSPPLKLAAK